MTFPTILFYFFATVLVVSGLCVITVRNAVYAALFLVLAFVTASALWLLLFAEFLAIALVLVYVGAVMVLFLFVVMMLDINFEKLREGFWRYLPVAATVALVMVIEMALLLKSKDFGLGIMSPGAPQPAASNVKELGRVLYTDYVLPFELSSVILLIVIVAAIARTLRKRKETKYQDMGAQIRVKSTERLKIISMPAEGKPIGDQGSRAGEGKS